MTFMRAFEQFVPGSGIAADGVEYLTDAFQRSVLFTDILRKRGNIYLEHLRNGKPPVLTFQYETIMKGTDLARPVNHDLTRIRPLDGQKAVKGKRPIVIIDPRAGHGPGIGGSKLDSQVGIALKEGHPVYFILFHPEPVPGQTLEDVEQAEIRFVEEVGTRHPDEDKPAVIGNCQAGWAVALLSADRPDVTGPIVLSGSPLSYWAGVEGKNRMRYSGGIFGGIWTACFLSDLGNGKFDGANLVANFATMEKCQSEVIKIMLDLYRDARDDTYEFMFKTIYGNPLVTSLYSESESKKADKKPEAAPKPIQLKLKREEKKANEGGFADGIVRIMLAMADADLIFDPKELAIAEKAVKSNDRLKKLDPDDFKRMVKEQAGILEADRKRALQSLKKLLPTPKDRLEAMEIAKNIANADLVLAEPEKVLMKRLREVLEV